MPDRICAVRSVESAPRAERTYGGDVMTAIPNPVRSGGTVAVLVRDKRATVDCPRWCTSPHVEAYRSLEDVSHHSDAISLTAPSHQGIEQVLTARISSWPFAGDPATETPFIAFDAVGDEVAQLTPEAALAAADQVIAHGYALRALVGIISGGAQ